MTAPAVSVLINCLNGARYLREAIDSVFAQTVSDWEIVFWDNASTDESLAIARSYGARVRCYTSDSTIPLYAARRAGMERCGGRVVGFLDCDDVWLPRKLERQLPLFSTTDVALVHSNAYVLDDQGRRKHRHSKRRPEGEVFASLLRDYHVCMPTAMISMAFCRQRGIEFDPTYTFSGDAELFMRLARAGTVGYVPESLAVYREHAGSGTLGSIDVIPFEAERILQRLASESEGFFERYRDEVIVWRRNAELSALVALLRCGARRDLANRLRSQLRTTAAAISIYAASFVPEAGVSWLRSLLKRA